MGVFERKDPVGGLIPTGGSILGEDNEEIAEGVVDQIESDIGDDLAVLAVVLNESVQKSLGIERVAQPKSDQVNGEFSSRESDHVPGEIQFGPQMLVGEVLDARPHGGLLSIPEISGIPVEGSRKSSAAVASDFDPLFVVMVIVSRNNEFARDGKWIVQTLKIVSSPKANKGSVLEEEIDAQALLSGHQRAIGI